MRYSIAHLFARGLCNIFIGRLHSNGSKPPRPVILGYPFPDFLVGDCGKGLKIDVLSAKIGITSIIPLHLEIGGVFLC